MLYELAKCDYENIRSFFKGLEYQLTTSSVLDNMSPGIIFVDDLNAPNAAFMHTVEGFFLAGLPQSEEFCSGLKEHVEGIIKSRRTMREGEEDLFFDINPRSWVSQFDEIFKIRPPLDCPRRHYVCTKLKLDWRDMVQEGFKVRRVDWNLINTSKNIIPQHMTNWMNLNWGSINGFLKNGFGFCTVHENQVVSWSIADCVSGDQCEIGIHTEPGYQRLGLATITAAAAVDFCLSSGYSQVGWHTDEHNYGSIEVAEKVGFVKERDYVQYVCLFDEALHIAETGLRMFLDKYYEEAIDLLNKAAQLGNIPGWAFYLLAKSHAILGNQVKALEYMKTSAKNGWSNIEHTLSCEELKCLHGHPEWGGIINLIKKNALIQNTH